MTLLKLLILGFIAGFVATLIFHQGLWWRVQSDWRHPARPAGLATRSHSAIRRAVGNLQGVLGRPMGRGLGAAARAIGRRKLLGELDR